MRKLELCSPSGSDPTTSKQQDTNTIVHTSSHSLSTVGAFFKTDQHRSALLIVTMWSSKQTDNVDTCSTRPVFCDTTRAPFTREPKANDHRFGAATPLIGLLNHQNNELHHFKSSRLTLTYIRSQRGRINTANFSNVGCFEVWDRFYTFFLSVWKELCTKVDNEPLNNNHINSVHSCMYTIVFIQLRHE